MILDTVYKIVESLNSMDTNIFTYIYIKYKRKKLIKMVKKYINKMDKDFFIDLIQFADLTGIFKIFSGTRMSYVVINNDIKVFISYRNTDIMVLYTQNTKEFRDSKYSWITTPSSYSLRVTKEFKKEISRETTDFPDESVNDIINIIHDTLIEKLTNYILNKEEANDDKRYR